MAVDTELVGIDQQPIDTPRVCSLCRCGETGYKPLCEGSHSQLGFDGKREDSDKKKLEYYRDKEITIVFDRYLCMGAGHCGELEALFGTHDAPKYEPDAAPKGIDVRWWFLLTLRVLSEKTAETWAGVTIQILKIDTPQK